MHVFPTNKSNLEESTFTLQMPRIFISMQCTSTCTQSFFCNSFMHILSFLSVVYASKSCICIFKCSNKNSNNCNENTMTMVVLYQHNSTVRLCFSPSLWVCLFVYVIQFNLCLFIFISYPNGWRNYVNEPKSSRMKSSIV